MSHDTSCFVAHESIPGGLTNAGPRTLRPLLLQLTRGAEHYWLGTGNYMGSREVKVCWSLFLAATIIFPRWYVYNFPSIVYASLSAPNHVPALQVSVSQRLWHTGAYSRGHTQRAGAHAYIQQQ